MLLSWGICTKKQKPIHFRLLNILLQQTAACIKSTGVRFQSLAFNTVTTVSDLGTWHVHLLKKNQQHRNQSVYTKYFPVNSPTHVAAKQRFYLCSERMAKALSGLYQAVRHTSATPLQPSISFSPSPLSPASARFTLTNAQEQAAPAGLWEAGRGGMDRGEIGFDR